MQFLVDLLPIIVFVAVYKGYGALVSADGALFAATGAIMVVMTIQIAIQWLRRRTVNKMLLVSGGLVLVLGGTTLAFHNPVFIQWKPSILYWLLSVSLIVSSFLGKMTLTQRALGHAIELPSRIWHGINMLWAVGFGLFGAANIYVVYNYSQSTWVNFKIYGFIGFAVVMAIIQGVYIELMARASDSQNAHDSDGMNDRPHD